MIGQQLGHYKIVSQLGRGGMASVYKAEQLGLGRPVALKILQPSLAADEIIVQRFAQEARIAANLHHNSIVTIYDVGELQGTHYIAMRFIDGENLGQLLRREGPLAPARAFAMLEQVAEALDYAHSRSILHRDIKPANVMVEPGDVLTLTDFGIARAGEANHLTATQMVIGTPEYMSPEQARGDTIDKRSDLYALGVLMYETLGGRPPFTAASTPSLLYLHVHEPPPPLHQLRPDLPRALSDVLSKALSKNPSDRFSSGREMIATARAALTQAPMAGPGPGVTGSVTLVDPNYGRGARPTGGHQPAPPPMRPTPMPPGQVPPSQGPPGSGTRPEPAARPAATRTLTPPPIPSTAQQPGAYRPTPAPQPFAQIGQQQQPQKRSNTWIIGPIVAAVALIVVGILVVTQSGLFGKGSTATPTPTVVAAKPTTAPIIAPTTAPAVATPAPTVQQASGPTVAPKPTDQPAKPTVPPTAPPAAKPTTPPAPAVPTAAPTPSSQDRIAAAQLAVASGDMPKAITELQAVHDDPKTAADPNFAKTVTETLRATHVTYGEMLLVQNKLDDSYGQFGEALKLVPNDPQGLDGQKRVILTKNYATMEANWGKDDEAAIKALEENMSLDPGFKDTRSKLYSLLISKADRLLAAGDRDAAFPVLTRALDVLPDGGEAQKRLASYTPTPAPTPVPVRPQPTPYRPPVQQPPVQPQPVQPQPQPVQPSGPFRPPGAPV